MARYKYLLHKETLYLYIAREKPDVELFIFKPEQSSLLLEDPP